MKLPILALAILLGLSAVLSSTSYYTCFQETANISTACGGLNNGSYAKTTNEGICCFCPEGSNRRFLYINYSKPSSATGATWQIKHGTLSTYNVSIPNACFSQIVQLRLASDFGIANATEDDYDTESFGQCYNASGWQNITTISRTYATEVCNSGAGTDSVNMFDGNYSTYAASQGDTWYTAVASQFAGERIYEEAIYWNMTNSTCTVPSINANWSMDSSENCSLSNQSINLGNGSISFTGNGTISFVNVTLNASGFGRQINDTGTNTTIWFNQSTITFKR